ncbi:MAG: DUF177 domain-containing protein [Chloroflexi bacterium]|nr:DUF177 domain-containing protein [Chloroflexota bacterium]
MRFNVAGLLRATVGATRDYELEPATVVDDSDRFENVHGPVHMLRTDRGVLVQARIEATGMDICSRCLTPISTEINARIEEEYYPINPFPGAGFDYEHPENTGGLDDTVFMVDDRNEIDLTEAARQALLSARPMAPLCKANCKGICPVCHIDRNIEECSCEETETSVSALGRLAQEWRKTQ